MRGSHLDGVMAIENQSFPAPWTRSAFASHLDHPEFAKYLVALLDDKVAGYVGIFFGGGYGQITNLAVDPDHRQQGIGTMLMLAVIDFALKKNISTLSLEVRVSNTAAQELYQKFGFVLIGLRKGYYQETGEDAYAMCLFNLKSEDLLERFRQLKNSGGKSVSADQTDQT